jgi:hypothetical protein
MDHSVGGRATIWRELRVKFGSDFGDVQPHMIGGGSLSQEVWHLSQQIGSASKIPVNFWVHFSLTRFQTSASRQKSVGGAWCEHVGLGCKCEHVRQFAGPGKAHRCVSLSGSVVVGNFPFQDTRHYLCIILGRHFIADDFDGFVDELRDLQRSWPPTLKPRTISSALRMQSFERVRLLSRVRREPALPPQIKLSKIHGSSR